MRRKSAPILVGTLLLAGIMLAEVEPVSASQTTTSEVCALHVYPADGVHSVGEDFDAVHQVDQDLHHYYQVAGRSLDWLTPTRQLALLDSVPLTALLGLNEGSKVMHSEPLSRHQAIEPGQHDKAGGCEVEIMLPQIMLERGGLATRSLRLFGVVRRYENGALISSYSGFAAAPMQGFQLQTPADADGATRLVEASYRTAVQSLLQNASKPAKN